MRNFLTNAVQRLIPRMTLDEGTGWERRTGSFATDSTVELKFLLEVFNIGEGDDIIGYEHHNLGQNGLEKMNENQRGHRVKKFLNNYIHKATWQSSYHVMHLLPATWSHNTPAPVKVICGTNKPHSLRQRKPGQGVTADGY